MVLNKDLIVRVIFGIVIFGLFVKIAIPFILEILKGDLFNKEEKDIDILIKRQQEKLKAQYGLATPTVYKENALVEKPDTFNPDSDEIKTLYKESKWGGGQYTNEIKKLVTQNYSYTFAETKINSFLQAMEKRNSLIFLTNQNQNSRAAIINYLSFILVFETILDEIKKQDFSIIDTVAKKLKISSFHLALAIQIKIYHVLKKQKGMKEDKVFSDRLTLHLIPDEYLKIALDEIIYKEANTLAKNHSLFFEELTIHLTYADLLIPLKPMKDKKDLPGAYAILEIDSDADISEIKQKYKKMALTYHPDKIIALNLPKTIENTVKNKFTTIKNAYDLIMQTRK